MEQKIQPRWLSRKGAVQYCGLSKTKLDVHIRRKDFVTKKIGKSRLIDRHSLDGWIENVPTTGGAVAPREVSVPLDQMEQMIAHLMSRIESLLDRKLGALAHEILKFKK
jgi:hypothetical protein